jgi:hypothetical protein
MPQIVKGTFTATGSVNLLGQVSDVLVIPTPSNAPAVNASSMKVTLLNNGHSVIDANNTVRTQRSLDSGQTWANQTTYNSAQNRTAVTVVHGEQWRLQLVTQQAGRSLDYELSIES